MWSIMISLLSLAFLCSPAYSFSHGLNTTFNPAQWPGATISTINCTGSDTTAFANWLTAAVAGNPTQQVLHVTGNCVVPADQPILRGVTNVVVWAYGATLNRIRIGAAGSSMGTATGAAFQSASAGATQVTLVNNSDGTKFSLNQWVAPTGLELQKGLGFPPNFQFFEYKQISALSGCDGSHVCTVTFNSPTQYTYLSTWPVVTSADGGPATLYPMDPSWDTTVQWFGGTIADSGQVVVSGKNISIYNFSPPTTGGNSGFDPTIAQTISLVNSGMGATEVDKEVDTLIITNCTGQAISVQSASVHNLQVSNCTLSQQFFGTPLNATIDRLTVPLFAVGPNGYGAATSLTVSNSTIATVRASLQFILAADFTWNGAGQFAIANNATDIGLAWQQGVPGHKYYFGDNVGNHATPDTSFTINSITQDGTNTYWNTDLPNGSLPACVSTTCYAIVSWGAMTITQTNTPGVNLTQFAP